ncbi:MAG TPA: flippase [Chloroflexota bacterium]|nr:flippase [Chloroflexota bacterium]
MLSASPALVAAWVALALAFAAASTWLLQRLLPRAATDNPVRRVAQNSAFPMATALGNKGLDLAFAIVMLRVLGPADAGAYAWVGVVVGYLDILLGFGMNTWLTREVARQPERLARELGRVLGARALFWLGVVLATLVLAGPLAGPLDVTPPKALALLLLALAMAPAGLSAALTAVFQARERMEYPAAVTVVTTVLKVALGLLALGLGYGFVGLAAVALAVNVLTLGALATLFVDLVGWPRLRLAPRAGLALVGDAYPFMMNNLLASLFFRLDSLLLPPLAGDVALGWYSAAYRVVDGFNLIPANFTLALFPLLARQGQTDRTALARVYRRALKVLLLLGMPIAVGTAVLAEPLVLFFAGPAYVPQAAWALRVLIWFLPFSFVNGVTQYVLIAVDRQRFLTIAFLVATAFNLVANLLLIPRTSYLGAALVTVLSEVVLLGPFWWAVTRSLPPISLWRLVWRPALAAAGMAAAVAPLAAWSWLLSIPVGAAVYAGLLAALGGFDADDRALWYRLRGVQA